MAAMLRNSVVGVIVVRTRPRAIADDKHEKINSRVSFAVPSLSLEFEALVAAGEFQEVQNRRGFF